MFSLNTHQKYYLYGPALDMRKGFNGISGIIRTQLGKNPLAKETEQNKEIFSLLFQYIFKDLDFVHEIHHVY